MMKRGIGVRAGRLVAGGALALLLVAGAVGPDQGGVTAGDPSQWGGAGRPTTTDDPQAARGSITIEDTGAVAVGLDRAGTRVGSAPGSRDST